MIKGVRGIVQSKGYVVYSRPWELNVVAFRSHFLRSNAFDDQLIVFYKNDKAQWEYHSFVCTTDPGQFWLDNPSNPQGTAFLKSGQYIHSHRLGLHRGAYEALVQVAPVTVVRNYNRTGLFNWFTSGYEDQGLFGINVHRAIREGTSLTVDKYSAGCIVLASAEAYNSFIALCNIHKSRYGNQFTVSLIDYRDTRKRLMSSIAWGASASAFGWLSYQLNQ